MEASGFSALTTEIGHRSIWSSDKADKPEAVLLNNSERGSGFLFFVTEIQYPMSAFDYFPTSRDFFDFNFSGVKSEAIFPSKSA